MASKYGNKRTEVDNFIFASKREARRYQELIVLQRAGLIRDLELQPDYPLIVNGVRVGIYRGDFRYVDCVTGQKILEDAKGVRTAVYQLKKKLVKAIYNIDIIEV